MAIKIGDVDILFKKQNNELENMWVPFGTDVLTLNKGWRKIPGAKEMPIDIIWEKDVPVTLRDGVKLYADVFRPKQETEKPLPALLPWSPFGKTGTGKQSLDNLPWRMGVAKTATSGLEKWEGPDPAEWCVRGYVVVNVDARGCFHSEGDAYIYGTQEGRDGYDTIEWIASQGWSNGSVALVGNSWLGTTQWFIAAEQPPHLKAIAPWEGLGDYYRESLCKGGVPDHAFWDWLFQTFGGKNRVEDVSAMVEKYPLWNEYWEDKKPQLGKINVPMYALASYSTGLHTEGSLRGFLLSSSENKWRGQWLGGDPRIRLSLLGYNQPSVVNRPVDSYPPPNFEYTTFYLDGANCQLSQSIPKPPNVPVSYHAENREDSGVTFSYRFDRYTELCGFSRAILFMSTEDSDDMDVYAVIRKLDSNGKPLQHFNIPFKDLPEDVGEKDIPHENIFRYVGPSGRIRASHREVMEEPGLTANQRELLSEAYVWHPHKREEKLPRGAIVKLELGLWPGGMVFHAGESMSLQIKGSHPILPEYGELKKVMKNYNVGRHTIHTGLEYPSSLRVALTVQ